MTQESALFSENKFEYQRNRNRYEAKVSLRAENSVL